MTYDETMQILDYLNQRTHGRWWRWATAEQWSWEKVEAYYYYLRGEVQEP